MTTEALWQAILAPVSQGGYLGAPFVWGGRGPDGYDCWGLVAVVRERLGQPVPDWSEVIYPDAKQAGAILAAKAETPDWLAVAEMAPGDIIALSTHRRVHHVGIASPWGVLHAARGYGAVHQEPADLRRTGYRLIQPYRYQGPAHG